MGFTVRWYPEGPWEFSVPSMDAEALNMTRDFVGLAPACVAEVGPGFPILTQNVFFNVYITGNEISIKYIIELKPLRIISCLCLTVFP